MCGLYSSASCGLLQTVNGALRSVTLYGKTTTLSVNCFTLLTHHGRLEKSAGVKSPVGSYSLTVHIRTKVKWIVFFSSTLTP